MRCLLVVVAAVAVGCGGGVGPADPADAGFVNSFGEYVEPPSRVADAGDPCPGNLRNQAACSTDRRRQLACTCDSTSATQCPGDGVWKTGDLCSDTELCGEVLDGGRFGNGIGCFSLE